KATLSAGIAVVHYKEDLRFALETARRAEKAAKEGGRNALMLTVCRRSGEHSSALCSWEFVEMVRDWVTGFGGGASDRWTYHLAAELPTLRGLPSEAIRTEILRQLRRGESGTKTKLPSEDLARAYDTYVEFTKKDH